MMTWVIRLRARRRLRRVLDALPPAPAELDAAERRDHLATLALRAAPSVVDAAVMLLPDGMRSPLELAIVGFAGARHAEARLVPYLTAIRQDQRAAAADALARLGWTPEDDLDRARLFIAQDQLEKAGALGGVAVAPLLELGSSCREEVSRALALIGDCAVDPLVDRLDPRDGAPRSVVRKALAACGDAGVDAALALLARCKPKGWRRRLLLEDSRADRLARAAIYVLGHARGNDRAYEHLQAVLAERSGPLRWTAAGALEYQGERAIDLLGGLLNDSDEHVRSEALWSLCSIGGRRAALVVQHLLGDRQHKPSNSFHQSRILDLLLADAAPGPPVRLLRRAFARWRLDRWQRRKLLRLAARNGSPTFLPEFRKALTSFDSEIASLGVEFLEKTADERTIRWLRRQRWNLRPGVRRLALRVRSVVDASKTVPELVGRLSSAVEGVQTAAVWSLARIGSPEALRAIADALPRARGGARRAILAVTRTEREQERAAPGGGGG